MLFDEAHACFSGGAGETLVEGKVELVQVDEGLFRRGFDYLVRHHDKRYSLTDCISFVVMAEHGLTKAAFTFDRHFVQAGFAA